jgi:predicted 2-oxoglutarate/Fe(II)-dependent dioxygenase YbiX
MNKIFCNFDYENKTKSTDIIIKKICEERNIIQNEIINGNPFYKDYYYPNIISNDICDFIINESEKYALKNKSKENPDGWTSKRHKNYPTTDLPLIEIQNLSTIVNNIIRYDILVKIAEKYNVNKYFLDVNDIFIVKYDANKQNNLEKHKDGCAFSFNVLLNSPEEFEGGGTIFYNTSDENNFKIVNNTKGGLIFHSGQQLHAGNIITKGIRYILVGFISYLRAYANQNQILNNGKLPNNIGELKKNENTNKFT